MTPAMLVAAGLVGGAVLVASPGSVVPRLARVAPCSVRAGPIPVVLASPGRVWRLVRSRLPSQRRQQRAATGDAVVELLESVAAALVAGRPPLPALDRVLDDVVDPSLARATAPVRGAVRTGRDLSAALVSAAGAPGCEPLRWLAAAWRLADSTGAGLATVVTQVAESARGEGEHRREVAAQLAAPRATARLLAFLPVVGVLIGELVGARPVSVLVGSPAGWACLGAGLALDVVGLRWTDRLARRAAAG